MVMLFVPAMMVPVVVPVSVPDPVFNDICTLVLAITFCGTLDPSCACTVMLKAVFSITLLPPLMLVTTN